MRAMYTPNIIFLDLFILIILCENYEALYHILFSILFLVPFSYFHIFFLKVRSGTLNLFSFRRVTGK
jgi:hypothetical protein